MPHIGGHIGGSPPGTWYQSLPGWQEVRWPDAGGQGRTPASQRHSPYGRKRIGTVKPPTVKLSRGSAGAGLPRPRFTWNYVSVIDRSNITFTRSGSSITGMPSPLPEPAVLLFTKVY